jgi:hypothetical protein
MRCLSYVYVRAVFISHPPFLEVLNASLDARGRQKGEVVISSTATFRRGMAEGVILRDDIYVMLPWKQVGG